ncbi:MAG: hypothetical protein JW776_09685 [Candidatus Lokiarchaeota archaeon]|nr:hypothetical protein [Candidatus Lokiarchaeota archaeon]
MDKREFKTIYEELLFNWELECSSEEITTFPEMKLKKFQNFQKEIHQLEHHAPPTDATEQDKAILWELKRESSKNIDYILNDLLAIRQEKIIRMCIDLEVIDLKNLTLSEQDFYRNLLSAFKGYKKTKQYYNAIADTCSEEESLIPPEETCEPMDASTPSKIEYCDVRILKNWSALVGPDLVTYGPFQKEDIVRLPKKSARIMEKEKIAELLE